MRTGTIYVWDEGRGSESFTRSMVSNAIFVSLRKKTRQLGCGSLIEHCHIDLFKEDVAKDVNVQQISVRKVKLKIGDKRLWLELL